MKKRLIRLAAGAGVWAGVCLGDGVKEKVDEVIVPVMEKGVAPAVVVGVVTREGTRVFGYGRLSETDGRRPDGETAFEIGSISKVFTGILLADMIERGELRAGDLVASCLPAGTTVPARNGKGITLEQLATHSSGLPRVPLVLAFKGLDDPYADEDGRRLYAVLEGMTLLKDPGESASYSNLGFALLGQALVEKSGVEYERLVVERICRPLGMGDTTVSLSEDQRRRLAPGHRKGKIVPNWTFKAYAGAGAIRSTASDMCRFVRANMELEEGRMGQVLAEAQRPRRELDKNSRVGFGWITSPLRKKKDGIVWHNGGTGGYSAFAGFVREAGVGVVVLMNAATGEGSEETVGGMRLLSKLTESGSVSPSLE